MYKKNEKEAVSPVIAVILMVAITVVLAAVLFVMVQQYTEDTPEGITAIEGSVDKTVEGWTITMVAGEIDFLDATWYISDSGVAQAVYATNITSNDNSEGGAGDDKLNAGDTFTITDTGHLFEDMTFVIDLDGSTWEKTLE